MPTITRILISALAAVLSACSTNGVTFDKAIADTEATPDGKARIIFLRTRDSALYIARKAAIALDGDKIGEAGYGSFFIYDIGAGSHRLRADMWDMRGQCELVFSATAGETYYFQVDPRAESFGAFASGDLATQLFTTNVFINTAGGFSAAAAESYGKQCGGAFRIYPVDAGAALPRLRSLQATPKTQ